MKTFLCAEGRVVSECQMGTLAAPPYFTIEVSDEVGATIFGGSAARPFLPLDQVKQEAIERVNRLAGECRARYITVIPGQESTYLMKEQEAREYATNPSGTFPMLEAEATASRKSVSEIVALVLYTATQWRMLAAAVEGIRRGAITDLEEAQTLAEIDAVQPIFPG